MAQIALEQEVKASTRNPLLGFNLLSAVILGMVGFVAGWWIGYAIANGYDSTQGQNFNDFSIILGYALATAGWLGGLGFFNYPFKRLMGAPRSLPRERGGSLIRYFQACTDHKVVGIQGFTAVMLFFFIGGLNAMFIRAELLKPTPWLWNPDQYITLVGLHGTMMISTMSMAIPLAFGNYFVPIMIGAKRMAFPRLESLAIWLFPLAMIILLSTTVLNGFPTGWTGYQPLADEAKAGMDAYLIAFSLVGIAFVVTAVNLMATIFTQRAPGMSFNRLPIFVWGILAVSILELFGGPFLILSQLMGVIDRMFDTTFFAASAGGSAYLYENEFWFFGHPEVYIVAIPGFALVLELLPVFCRKPLFSYRLAVAGLLGVTLLSFMVWQHHLFDSGMDANLGIFFMTTTEMISIPTGFIYYNAMGTMWKSKMWYPTAMLFTLAFFINFLIGGISGVFNSDIPSDVTSHGSFFVMAHFHYTILGGLGFALMAGCYYWMPKMFGFRLNETLGKIHFWTMFIAFNSTFLPLFAVGMMDMPRRVDTYAKNLQGINDWVSVSAFVLGFSFLIFLWNIIYSMLIRQDKSDPNPWQSRGLEWMVPTPVPVHNFERTPLILATPYEYGVPDAPPVADLTGVGASEEGR